MAEEKSSGKKRQTKAGLMQKNKSQTSGEEEQSASEKDAAKTPKISKNEATDHNHDRPLH